MIAKYFKIIKNNNLMGCLIKMVKKKQSEAFVSFEREEKKPRNKKQNSKRRKVK